MSEAFIYIEKERYAPPPADPYQVTALVTGKRPKRKQRKRGKRRGWAWTWRR